MLTTKFYLCDLHLTEAWLVDSEGEATQEAFDYLDGLPQGISDKSRN